MNKQTVVHPVHGILALKRNELSSHAKSRRNLKCIFLNKISQCEKATYGLIPTIWHSEKGKTVEKVKKIGRCQGLRGRMRWIGGAWRIFRALKLFLYDTTMVLTCRYAFVKTHRMRNAVSEYNANYGLWVMYQFMNCNKWTCTTPVGIFLWGDYAGVGQGV